MGASLALDRDLEARRSTDPTREHGEVALEGQKGDVR
jgi:hypothetical protein